MADPSSGGNDSPFGDTPFQATTAGPVHSSSVKSDDAVSVVIPYKNPKALLAYYLGLGAILPCIGLFAGVPAFILGILGLRDRARNPEIHGSIHAWIGILLGGFFSLLWLVAIVITIIGAFAERH